MSSPGTMFWQQHACLCQSLKSFPTRVQRRAARNSSRPAIAKTPPAKKQLQARPQPAIPSHNLEEEDGDLVLVDSDDDTEVAQKAAAKRALAQEDSQLFGLESQSLPDKPSLTTSTTPAQACLAASLLVVPPGRRDFACQHLVWSVGLLLTHYSRCLKWSVHLAGKAEAAGRTHVLHAAWALAGQPG